MKPWSMKNYKIKYFGYGPKDLVFDCFSYNKGFCKKLQINFINAIEYR